MKQMLIITTLLFLLFSCSDKDETSSASTTEDYTNTELPPLAVEVIEVIPDRLIPTIELSGSVEGINEVSLLSQTQGTISQVFVRLGQEVTKGDPLVKVDDNLALLNLKAAEEQLATATIDFDALNKSLNQGGSSRRELSAARNRLAAARAAEEAARQNYENCTLRAPINGTISALERSISTGNSLSPGSPVARIINQSSWVVEGYLGERQIGMISQGSEVTVKVPSAGNGPEKGQVTAIASGGELSTGSYLIHIEWASENDRIRSGMTASVSIPTEADESLIIPASAIVAREGKDYVFIELGGVAEARLIERGAILGNRLETTSGLQGGDRLIISGLNSLSPGRKVTPSLVDRLEALE